jgi:uncharacterized protein YhfF
MAVIYGTTGNDVINTTSNPASTTAADYINGGSGNDYVFGGQGDDVLVGGNGNDVVNGGTGNDRLAGGVGDDWLDGGAGYDMLRGGAGDDVLVWDDKDFLGAWTTVANPFAVGQVSTFVLGATPSASTTSTYAGNDDMDVINASFSASGIIDMTGKAVGTIEVVAVKATIHNVEKVTASLAEMRQENQSELSTGTVAGNNRATIASFVLGGEAGDSINLAGQGWNYDAAATALSAHEIQTLRSVVGVPISLGVDGNPNSLDLHAFVFSNGNNSVTVWTDESLDHFHLNGNDIILPV